jgi:hypothetical protein
MQQQQRPMAIRGHQRPAGHHLKLIQYLPPGGVPHVCAAIWREGDHVQLASPLLRTRRGVRDPRSYVRQFPDGLASIDAFEDTMTWLEAACYAATDPREVESACQQHPEWQLHCIRYDGGDITLLGLAGLIRAAERIDPLPESVVRDCLLELIKQILRNDPVLAGAQIDKAFRDGDNVASLDLGSERQVQVTVLRNIAATDLVREGLLAHHRMTDKRSGWTQCLLVLPDLDIERPMFMTSRVAITSMDPEHMRASLVHMAKQVANPSIPRAS